MEYEKHFLSEDFTHLNVQINRMHQSSLDVIDFTLQGDLKKAEQAAHQIYKALNIVKALNSKKVIRDDQERHAMATRKAFF
ncbi:hypothetical protein [Sediminibacillus massiliensis]|uniref:hypothetical protein n=1 Tax=Sediminibacillus massiliensis TaxID=1926277 RepID=UPI0009884D52|nr:hypothetical protein [Sediminibacillus massiliensis]